MKKLIFPKHMKKLWMLILLFSLFVPLQAKGDTLVFGQFGWVTRTDCSGVIAEGLGCWDSDNDVFYIGTGAAAKSITGIAADGSVPFTGAPIPNAANTIAIGSTAAEWADFYLGDGAVIYGQNDQSNTMTSSATGWIFNLAPTFPGAEFLDGFTVFQDADVAHGITGIDATITTATFGAIYPSIATAGGMSILGISDSSDVLGTEVIGIIGSPDPADSVAAVYLRGGKKNNTVWQALGNAESVLKIQNYLTDLITVFGDGTTVFAGGATVGGTLTMGANNITGTGSLGATGAGKFLKLWSIDAELTNLPTINGGTLIAALHQDDIQTLTGVAAEATNLGAFTGSTLTDNTLTIKAAFQEVETSLETKMDTSSAATYTEPGSNLPICRTGVGTIGACTNLTDLAFSSYAVLDSPSFTDDITIAAAGVKLTGSNGSLTILGLGDGQDEDLKIDLNTTANEIGISSPASSASKVNFGSLNLATTGSIQGAITINSDANGMSSAEMTTAGMYGTMFFATGAGTWALPGAATGMNFCVYSTTAAAIVINPDDSDVIVLNGTALSAGDSITSASGAGDFICLVALDATNWYTLGRSGTWTDTN